MKVIFDPEVPLKFSTSATIGIFDGVHIGHRRIISLLRKDAKEKGISSCVITFHPHPQKVLRGIDVPLIVPLKERFGLLKKEGVDVTVCYSFTKEFASVQAEDFVRDMLVGRVELALSDGEVISSTTIRKLIEEGMVRKAARFLGYSFSIEGTVKEGERRGTKLGFPTANIDTEWELLPKRGVYVTWAHLGGERFESIDALVEQISRDVKRTKEIFSELI